MKLTKEEVQKKSQEKVRAIQTLCNQLEVVLTAEQVINSQGFIKNIVYYTDIEKYDIVEDNSSKPLDYEETTPEPENEA